MKIPKKLGQIWIGPKKAPEAWMQSWKNHNPEWEYTLYGNDFLNARKFRTSRQIAEYMKRGWYVGVGDLLRYEILYETGGYLAEADSVCVHAIEELFVGNESLYTVYENEFLRGKLVSPIVACEPGHPFWN